MGIRLLVKQEERNRYYYRHIKGSNKIYFKKYDYSSKRKKWILNTKYSRTEEELKKLGWGNIEEFLKNRLEKGFKKLEG